MDKKFLDQILSYCPETGVFRWKVSRPPRGKAGDIAGYNNGSGYIKISISGKRHYAHRLAFVMMGHPEPKVVDHINRVKHDNSWKNLRAVTQKENGLNKASSHGVQKRYGKWYARISNNHIGVFDTQEDAINAYKQAKKDILQDFVDGEILVKNYVVKKWSHNKKLFNGKTLSKISRETNIPQPVLYYRVHNLNLSVDQAISMGKSSRSVDSAP